MSTTESAMENLRIIRSLMEKAHIYRAVSAPAALMGGALAVAAGFGPVAHAVRSQATSAFFGSVSFLFVWLSLLAITSALNVVLLAREAKRRGQPFVSSGMRTALRAFIPPMLVGGVLGIGLILFLDQLVLAALLWVLGYGQALLATASFSPRSLVRLGWAFVIAGLALFLLWAANSDTRLMRTEDGLASLIMASTFGLLHLVYAMAVFLGRKPAEVKAE